MKVVIAIDSLKGCLSSAEAGRAAAEGVRAHWPEAEIVCLPVSDGGEGWLEAVMAPYNPPVGDNGDWKMDNGKWGKGEEKWERVVTVVSDPLMRPVEASYLMAGETAVIEIAQACGLHLLKPEERNPLKASSRGVGELIADAMRRGCRHFIVGLGGSATSDAGRGMVEGVKSGKVKSEGMKSEKWSEEFSFILACDVTNPLYGPNGAAAVFAPQKGATAEMVRELDARARTYSKKNARAMGYDCSQKPGAGAAGGLGYAFMQFFGAECRSGAELLMELLHFDDLIRGADLVITGEGRADRQTLMGKLPSVILHHALKAHVPCHLVAGAVEDEADLLGAGFAAIHCITPADQPLHEALRPEVARQNMLGTMLRWRD